LYNGLPAFHMFGMAHDHNHSHSHTPKNFGAAFATATALNFALVIVQVVYGLSANSVALLADAGHNFGDALGLLLAWGAHVLARVEPTERFTYGYRSASILSALINAAMLLIATGAIAWEAIRRFADPGDVGGLTVMVIAAVGIVVNGLSAWLLMAGQKGDLNIRGAFAHLLADAAVSVAVVVAGGVILLTGWMWVDPAASLVISVVVVWSTWGLLRESVRMSMDAVPAQINSADVRQYLEKLPGVASVHDLHIWAMSTTENALTAHLIVPSGHPGDQFLAELCHDLDHHFKIKHPTVQIELGDAGPCILAPATTI
jgi:cobalt-zinc-cadmium efflux system protein